MSKTVGQPATAGRVVNFPSPQIRESLIVRKLADAYRTTRPAGRYDVVRCRPGRVSRTLPNAPTRTATRPA
jgi:hypothetical protein